ncbi:hypothetical protein PPN31114_03498 [Pandoraea pneumonica]|uniref:Chemotaxis protein n=1 Tax=Pandoraea pneumonica TaxID=2508299 RepID=A0A5E4WXX9_9BURK|nr:hypothetical protein [Pandoraea pneumonica]VVE27925.1 hypothetical protein PPN31114_03498 [Pandoraea pneumonica]
MGVLDVTAWTSKGGLIVALLLLGVLAGFGGGWVVNGWRMTAAIAEERHARAEDRASAAEAALADFVKGADLVRDAAKSYTDERAAIVGKLDQLSKDLKNYANEKPLPVDCRPDAGRLRSLSDAIDAAKQAATR